MVNHCNYIFIAAFGRSGSTLLASQLAEISGYESVGEFFPGIIWRNPSYQCSCGKSVDQCDFYSMIEELLSDEERQIIIQGDSLLNYNFGIRQKLSLMPIHQNFLSYIQNKFLVSEPLKKYAHLIGKLIPQIVNHRGNSVFIDASKQYYLLNLYRNFGFKGIKIIHLYRNPLGVYASRKRTDNINIEKFCSSYNRYFNFNSDFIRYKNIDGYLEIDYDNLIMDNFDQIEKIKQFIGYNGGDCNKLISHIGGNVGRMKQNNLLRLDDRWKKELSMKEINFIKANTRYPNFD